MGVWTWWLDVMNGVLLYVAWSEIGFTFDSVYFLQIDYTISIHINHHGNSWTVNTPYRLICIESCESCVHQGLASTRTLFAAPGAGYNPLTVDEEVVACSVAISKYNRTNPGTMQSLQFLQPFESFCFPAFSASFCRYSKDVKRIEWYDTIWYNIYIHIIFDSLIMM